MKNPERVGQASGVGQHGVRFLTRMRKAPPRRRRMGRQRFCKIYIEKIEERYGMMTDAEKQKLIAAIDNAVSRACSMSDVDFELKKESLATGFEVKKPDSRRPRPNQLGKVGRFLLDERLIPILEQRLRQTG